MSDLICRKSMARCLTPGMCSPHGGCQPDKTEWQSGYDEGRRMGTKHMYAERDQLKAENEALREEVPLDDKLIADRDRLLNMFECPVHGQCIPYAMEQVEELRKDADRLQSAATFVQKLCDSAGTQPSVATGYLHDILSALGSGEQL